MLVGYTLLNSKQLQYSPTQPLDAADIMAIQKIEVTTENAWH